MNLSSPAANAKAASSLTPLYDVSPGGTVIRPPPEPPGGQAMNSWGWSSVGPAFGGPFGSPPSEFRIPGAQGAPGLSAPAKASSSTKGNLDSEPPGFGEMPEEPTRVSLELPKLERYDPATSSIVAGDWLTAITPVMCSLSAGAAGFWQDARATAMEFYHKWLGSSPLDRLHLHLVTRYHAGRFSRVDQRAVSMLLSSIGSELKKDVISLKLMGTASILVRVLTRYQPGGATEKQQLLTFLVNPEPGQSNASIVKALRKWRRWLTRVLELHLIPPDPSLQLKGLEKLMPVLSPTAIFRIQTFKTQAMLDQSPSQKSVLQYAELLLAEAEEAVLAEGPEKQPKKPGISRLDTDTLGAGEAKGGKGGKGGKSTPGPLSPCVLWRTDEGCRFGKACRFQHDQLAPSDKRCFNCSSTKHHKPDCPYPKSRPEASSTAATGGKKGKGEKEEARKVNSKGQPPTSEEAPKAASAKESMSKEELIAKAAEMLDSLKASVKALEPRSYPPKPKDSGLTGLIDSGATISLRPRRPGEPIQGYRTVALAEGETRLAVSSGGVLLRSQDCEPIVSLRQLVSLGFRLNWGKRSCQLFDDHGHAIPVSVSSGCSRVSRALSLALIDRIEQERIKGCQIEQVCKVELPKGTWREAAGRLATSFEQADPQQASDKMCLCSHVL